MKERKMISVLLILVIFVGASFSIFAVTREEKEDAYWSGYREGYSLARVNGKSSDTHIYTEGGYAANRMYRKTTNENRALKTEYRSGFIQGWHDKEDGKPNQYFERTD